MGICRGGLSGQGDRAERGLSADWHVVHYREEQKDGRKPSKTPALLKSQNWLGSCFAGRFAEELWAAVSSSSAHCRCRYSHWGFWCGPASPWGREELKNAQSQVLEDFGGAGGRKAVAPPERDLRVVG